MGEEGGGLLVHGRGVREIDAGGGGGGGVVGRLDDQTNGNDTFDKPKEKQDDNADDIDDEDEDNEARTAIRLALLRRAEHSQHKPSPTNGHTSHDSDNNDSNSDESTANGPAADTAPPPPPFYMTHNYRNILGIVPLSRPSGQVSEGAAAGEERENRKGFTPLEVALIERPHWDLDLGPRIENAWKAKG